MSQENTKPNENESQEKESWLDEHGQPDSTYLHSLATDTNPEAIEKLRAIADDLNVEYDETISPEELVGRIRTTTEENARGSGVAT